MMLISPRFIVIKMEVSIICDISSGPRPAPPCRRAGAQHRTGLPGRNNYGAARRSDRHRAPMACKADPNGMLYEEARGASRLGARIRSYEHARRARR